MKINKKDTAREAAIPTVKKSQTVTAKMPTKAAAATAKETTKMATQQTNSNSNSTPKIKVPTRYSDDDLEMFREVIKAYKDEALDELRMLEDRLESFNDSDMAEESMIYSLHMGEQGSEAIEKEKTYAQIQRTSEYIQKLNEALKRIDNKTYGICRVCNCLIAKERLLVVPITTLSASYKIHQKCPNDGVDKIEKR